jgi:hypothetical protein
MRQEPVEIKLGDNTFRIRPLTLGQVRRIEPVLVNSYAGSGNLDAAITIVQIALERDNPAGAAGLQDIEATAPELGAAMGVVLRLGGFIPPEDAPGEA